MAGEVGNHCTADDDAEPVGYIAHHSDCGDCLSKGIEGVDDCFGFGIDDLVFHMGA